MCVGGGGRGGGTDWFVLSCQCARETNLTRLMRFMSICTCAYVIIVDYYFIYFLLLFFSTDCVLFLAGSCTSDQPRIKQCRAMSLPLQ